MGDQSFPNYLPGTRFRDKFPGVGGHGVTPRARHSLRGEVDLEKVCDAGNKLGRDAELAGPGLGHDHPRLGLTVPDLHPLLQRLARQGVLREVRGEAVLQDCLYNCPHRARALIGLNMLQMNF